MWILEGQEEGSSRVKCSDCTDEMKKERGCDGGVIWKVGGMDVDGCPEKYITPEKVRLINMWSNWKMFGLPFQGTWMEQPFFIIDTIKILESEKNKYDARKRSQ